MAVDRILLIAFLAEGTEEQLAAVRNRLVKEWDAAEAADSLTA